MKTLVTSKPLPEHLFVSSCDGCLHDTRLPDWSFQSALRPVFCRTYQEISNTQQFKATLRAGAFAWPGGYPLYFITSDGAALSFDALKDKITLRCVLSSIRDQSNDGWQVVGCDVNWEDAELYCAHTGKRIESAYAE